MDKICKNKRSQNMSKVKSFGTKPELIVRKLLFSMGFRYRINVKKLPGKPDIVLKKYNVIIFVNGCFWHQHKGCSKGTLPKTNKEFWRTKLQNNIVRDKNNIFKLENDGWKVLVLWECELEDLEEIKSRLLNFIIPDSKDHKEYDRKQQSSFK